jgi:superfamily II DNA helicase RecQ
MTEFYASPTRQRIVTEPYFIAYTPAAQLTKQRSLNHQSLDEYGDEASPSRMKWALSKSMSKSIENCRIKMAETNFSLAPVQEEARPASKSPTKGKKKVVKKAVQKNAPIDLGATEAVLANPAGPSSAARAPLDLEDAATRLQEATD